MDAITFCITVPYAQPLQFDLRTEPHYTAVDTRIYCFAFRDFTHFLPLRFGCGVRCHAYQYFQSKVFRFTNLKTLTVCTQILRWTGQRTTSP